MKPLTSPSLRTVAVLIVLGVVPFARIHAQSSGNTFGLKAGVNWSNLRADGEDANDENARCGFHGAIFGRLAPSDQLGLQAELLYSTKGTTVTYDGLIDQEVTFNLAYLELPVFATIGVGKVLEIHAGAYAAYLLSSNVTTEGDLGSDSEDLDRDNFQGADYGLLIGLGFNLGPVQIGSHYAYGLSKLAASDGAELLLGDARNSALQFYLAIGLGGK